MIMANWFKLLRDAMSPRRKEKRVPTGATPPFVAQYEDDEYDNPADRLPPPFRPQMPEMSKGLERRDMMRRQPMPTESRDLDGDIQAMEDSIRDAYQQPIENRRTKNWFQKLGRGFNKFGRSYRSGKGIVGAVSDTLDPTYDERMNRQDQINQMFGQYANLRKMQEAEQNDQLREAQIDFAQQRPDIAAEQNRLRAYNAETGRMKAEAQTKLQDEILKLRREGVDQNDRRIKILETQLEETKRANLEREKDRDLDREARETIARIRETGITDRTQYTESQKLLRQQLANQLREALDAARRNPNDPKAKQKVADIRKQIQDDPALQ